MFLWASMARSCLFRTVGPSDRAGMSGWSAAYDEQLQRATALGWPIRSLDLSHLAPLTHPTHVADAIAEVLNELETR